MAAEPCSLRRLSLSRVDGEKAYTQDVRRFATFVGIFLLLITAAPVLACVTGSDMSHQERACCRAMHGDCGEMAKTGCCQTELRADVHPQLAASAPHLCLHILPVDWSVPALTAQFVSRIAVFRSPDEHSPPGLLIATLTVLRV